MKNEKLFFSCGKHENMLYCNLFLGMTLARMNLQNGEFTILNGMNGPNVTGWWGGTDYLFYGDKLYLVSNRLNCIAEYSLSREECKYWYIDEPLHALSCPNYSLSLLFQNKIYIFPKFDDIVRVFDINTHKIIEHKHLVLDTSYCCEEENAGEGNALISKAMQVGDSVWLFSRQKPIVWKYSLITNDIEECFDLGECAGCVDATMYDENFYILDDFGNIFLWRGEKATLLCSTNRGDMYFIRIAVTKSFAWLLPCFGEDILRYNFLTKKLEVYQGMPSDFRYTLKYEIQAKFYKGCEDDKHYYFTMCASTHVLILDKTTDDTRWIKPSYRSIKDKLNHLQLANSYTKKFLENDIYIFNFDLEDYLLYIDYATKQKNEDEIHFGKKIFDFVIGEN